MLVILPVLLSIVIAAIFPAQLLPAPLNHAFADGGWGMKLILFAFFMSAWLTIDRTLCLLRATLDGKAFWSKIQEFLTRNDAQGAVQYCQQLDKPLSRIVGAGLSRASLGEQAVLEGMDLQAYRELPQLEKRTGYLALLGNVATLMGLFGTIVGLIKSFSGVAGRETSEKATLLAAGISEAMNCTAFGLLTGIAALFAFSVLNGKTQALVDEINFLSHRIFRFWKARTPGVTSTAKPSIAVHPIVTPAPRLMQTIGLSRAKGHATGRKSTFASLQLTPLIDMFIVLVIFLLMSFSATGEIITVAKDLRLPFALNVEKLKRVPVVAIAHPPGTPGYVALEGQEVATAQELIDNPNPDWKIEKLTAQLELTKQNWKVTNPSEEFTGELIIQADENVGFNVLKKVMYSAGVAGYGNLLFAVVDRSGESQ